MEPIFEVTASIDHNKLWSREWRGWADTITLRMNVCSNYDRRTCEGKTQGSLQQHEYGSQQRVVTNWQVQGRINSQNNAKAADKGRNSRYVDIHGKTLHQVKCTKARYSKQHGGNRRDKAVLSSIEQSLVQEERSCRNEQSSTCIEEQIQQEKRQNKHQLVYLHDYDENDGERCQNHDGIPQSPPILIVSLKFTRDFLETERTFQKIMGCFPMYCNKQT